jgi:hypothetical protein
MIERRTRGRQVPSGADEPVDYKWTTTEVFAIGLRLCNGESEQLRAQEGHVDDDERRR